MFEVQVIFLIRNDEPFLRYFMKLNMDFMLNEILAGTYHQWNLKISVDP